MTALFPLVAKAAMTARRGRVLVGPVSLTLGGQGITVVIGPNGSGKTTLLRLLHGTARLTSGTLGWACPMEEARSELAFVFQRPVMLRRSVLQNLTYPLRLRGMPRAAARARATDRAGEIGLTQMLDRPATSLSGGEMQKLALARAFITDPKAVFLDEPTAALDGAATREIETMLSDAKAQGRRLILATHDMGQARRLADEVVFLHQGQVGETGPAAAFFDRPQTVQAAAFLRGDIVE